MTAIARSISFAAVVFVLLGCGDRFQFAGKWTGQREVQAQQGANPDVVNTLKRVTVKIDNEGRFEMFDQGISFAGPVQHDGSDLVLKPDTMLDRPLDRQPQDVRDAIKSARLKGNKDGTVTFSEEGGEPVTLKRESQR
ncbi:hypothetical protein [Fimbriimonas ginsengisoli]|nr:hypothetical protein [Fimbriimonas ginsengisoli]